MSSTVSETELRVLENRMAAHLVDVARRENYTIVEPVNRDEVLTALRQSGRTLSGTAVEVDTRVPARGLITAEINRLSDRLFADLFLYSLSTGNLLRSQSAAYDSMDDLLSGLEFLVYDLFDIPYERVARATGARSSQGPILPSFTRFIQLSDLVGRWRGDEGLGEVTIAENGTAIARLPESDDTLRLRITIGSDRVVVRQDEANAPKIYMPFFPFSISVQLVDQVRPMSWEFRLSADRQQLIGQKDTSYIYVERGQVARVDNSYSRPATWVRLP